MIRLFKGLFPFFCGILLHSIYTMASEEENSTGILGAVSSAAQQATSVVSSALEAMHITAPHDQDTEAQDEKKAENGNENGDEKEAGAEEQESRQEDKDAGDLEDGEIREANGKEEKQGPRTVFDDPASFNLKVGHEAGVSPYPMVTNDPFPNRSTHCTHRGHFISVRQPLKICLKLPHLHRPTAAQRKRPQDGWRRSER
jgi:hypothetical protein